MLPRPPRHDTHTPSPAHSLVDAVDVASDTGSSVSAVANAPAFDPANFAALPAVVVHPVDPSVDEFLALVKDAPPLLPPPLHNSGAVTMLQRICTPFACVFELTRGILSALPPLTSSCPSKTPTSATSGTEHTADSLCVFSVRRRTLIIAIVHLLSLSVPLLGLLLLLPPT